MSSGSNKAQALACGAVVALVMLAAGLNAAAPATEDLPDLRSIKDKGLLRIAITHFDIPPFHVRDGAGTYIGKDIDFAKQLGNALKVQIAFVDDPPTFDAVVDAVAAGRADIGLSKLSETYDRVTYVRFSRPYMTLRHALLYNRDIISRLSTGRPGDALRNFTGRIGVIGRSAYVDFATDNYPNASIVPFATWQATIAALKRGDVDVVYRDEFEARSVLINDPAMHVAFGAAIIADRRSFLTMAICDSCLKLEEFINYFIAQHPREYSLDDLLKISYEN